MKRSRMAVAAQAALLCCAIAMPAAAQPRWQPFTWHVDSFAGGPPERLALFLPVTIDGAPCLVQLDTGANGEWMWAGQAAPGQQLPRKTVTIELAGIRKEIQADAQNLRYVNPQVCAIRAVATVGNAFFEHGTLTLDLGKARFAYTNEPLLAGDPAAHPLFYARWGQTGGHTLVELGLQGARPSYALLDTGAARFGLAATDAGEWAELTGGAPLAAGGNVRQFGLESWGNQVQCFETSAAHRLTVAGVALEETRVSYCVDQGFRSPVKLAGVLGLRPLGDRVVTLDYLSRRWKLEDGRATPAGRKQP
ncbi:hypothetical protein OU994_16305 [Pseudoduganella sp. SL102]|uniref:hypothetical protein n=1 Tax=Pseudoduganella sp. SL102 TaxID=2995154 RepID=UPI00248D1311|nr:hypothetical protein [Pseudoduganella sp. SL102]WBR99888.1 hypothetical protein OU994_16305 [Pseudoduganella sp. SL102]